MKTNATTAVALFVGDLSPGGYLLRASFALASVPGSRDSGECQTATLWSPRQRHTGAQRRSLGTAAGLAPRGQASEGASGGRHQKRPGVGTRRVVEPERGVGLTVRTLSLTFTMSP